MKQKAHKVQKNPKTTILKKKVRTSPILRNRQIFRYTQHSVIYEMKRTIRAQNKYLTNQYLKKQTPYVLCCLAHPLYRMNYAYQLLKMGKITKKQLYTLRPPILVRENEYI